MSKLSRRRLLQTSAALGVTGLASHTLGTEVAQSTPDLEKYVQELPIPGVLEPDEQRDGVDYYNIPITEFDQSLHPDLPDTTVWGFDGSFPGPIIEAQKDEPIKVEFDNSDLPDEHLLEVDERVHGTTTENHMHHDGPVPEVRNSIHFHGLNIESESDGQSTMWVSPDGVEGPRRTKDVQDVPNAQSRLTGTYHAHTLGITRLNAYAGLAGLYYIRSEQEEQLDLPDGEYDIPLVIQARSFTDDGSLDYPDSFVAEPSHDTAVVNGAIWPYLEVEPRKYRFRIVNGSNHRTFNMNLSNESGSAVPTMYQYSSGHGFLEDVVAIEDGGDMESLLLTPFERGEVVVDFSEYAGETFTLTNDAEFPYMGGNDGEDFPEILQIRVTDPSEEPEDPSADPTTLDLPAPTEIDEDDAVETRHFTLDMEVTDGDGPPITHLLNGYGMGDEGAPVPQPELGTTEIWEFENTTSHAHPMHLHLVDFRVIGRGPDGEADPDPNELGGKDTVRVEPDETVRIAAEFGDFTGQYPFHCHALEHEDHKMMLMFDVVEGEGDGDEGTLTHHDPADLDHVGDDVDHVIQWEGSIDD
ncbi:multicopper oxidase family protein (plasmid) [Natrialbaceae archaeon A-arb3/5]